MMQTPGRTSHTHYSLDLKLRELFHEHGTFIGTEQVIINEPTGDVAKYAKGDQNSVKTNRR
jgi:hypothetical protein